MDGVLDPIGAPALAVIELASLSRAAVVLDAIVKQSPVTLHTARRVSPGKFLIVVQGGVAEVEEGFGAAIRAAQDLIVDQLLLPQAHLQIHDALLNRFRPVEIDALALFETYTAAAAVRAADAAIKATDMDLVGLHLCVGIGGKGYWALTGPLHLAEEAVAVGRAHIPADALVSADIVPRPHPEAVEAYLAPFRV